MVKGKSTAVAITPPKKGFTTIHIIGDSILVPHAWAEKAKKELAEKHQKKGSSLKVREAQNPEEEALACLYRIGSNGDSGIPAIGIKKMIVRAASFTDMPMTQIKGLIFIPGDLIKIISKKAPTMRDDMVRTSGMSRNPMHRYRMQYEEWEMKIPVIFDADHMTAEMVANLFERAGMSVGLCEFRPEKGGSWGMFHVKVGKNG